MGRLKFESNQTGKPLTEHTPGKTPIVTLLPVLQKIKNFDKRCLIDLGCGRGELAIQIAEIFRCTVIGIDLIPTYIRVANRFIEKEKISNISFIEGDFLMADLSKGDVFYVTLTCLEADTIMMLSQKLALIQRNILVITTSAPLSGDYFKILHQYFGYFSWGKGVIYIQQKR